MARGQGHPARSVATAAVASALMALLAASGGCEVVVGREQPAFACDPGPDVCPGNQICDPSTHQCVAPCDMTGCKAGLQCDPASHLCVTGDGGSGADVQVADGDAGGDDASMQDQVSPPDTGGDSGTCRGLGCKCGGNSDCDSNLCAGASNVSLLYPATGSHDFCSKPCCTSEDCDANTVCYAASYPNAPSTIGNYCVLPVWLGRSTTLGTAKGGSTCSSNSDCRSGLCSANHCADTCCSTNGSSTECAGGAECHFDTFPGTVSADKNYTAFCGTSGTGPNGSSCSSPTDCQSNLCDTFNGTCRNACRNTADCGGQGVSCTFVLVGSNPGNPVVACFPGGGSGAEGQSCSSDTQCESQFCSTTTNECTDVCFADSDCTKSGWHCRPEGVTIQGGGSYTVLACGS